MNVCLWSDCNFYEASRLVEEESRVSMEINHSDISCHSWSINRHFYLLALETVKAISCTRWQTAHSFEYLWSEKIWWIFEEGWWREMKSCGSSNVFQIQRSVLIMSMILGEWLLKIRIMNKWKAFDISRRGHLNSPWSCWAGWAFKERTSCHCFHKKYYVSRHRFHVE